MKDSMTLQWVNNRPEGTDEMVIADIRANLEDLSSPAALIYHTVFLGHDMETTPGVIVTGEDGNPNFICEYFAAIGDAFETARPNENEPGVDQSACERYDAADGNDVESSRFPISPQPPRRTDREAYYPDGHDRLAAERSLKFFLRDRGGQKAQPSDEDFNLGFDASKGSKESPAEQQD